MTAPTLSTIAQIQYMVQWFEEWSEFQRHDFLPILAEKMASNGLYVNGLVDAMNSVNCQDKPMSLFQCRVKLFNDWFATWSADDRTNLIKRLSEIDESFGVKLHEEISGNKQVVDDDHLQVENGSEESHGNATSPEAEVENREVIDDKEEHPPIITDNQIPIQIVE